MLSGFSYGLPAQIRVHTGGLRFLRQYSGGLRNAGFKYKLNTRNSASKPISERADCRSMNVLRRWSLLVLLGREGRGEMVEQVREVTRYLLRTVARQSEVHTSQKLRRALQLYSAYSRLWGEEAARNMLASLRRTLASKGRNLLLSAVCFSNFNWEHEKISNERLQESAKDIETIEDLFRATIKCDSCGKRLVIDQEMVNVEYCLCDGRLGYADNTREYESWRPFIEREHHVVWRQRHHKHNHLFAYKVYGSYQDVSLSSFMETQLNCSYRTEWDDTALQLKVLNSDQDSNSDLVYWLVKFPHFFANRDYLFKRRFYVNRERREVVIMSEAVSSDILAEEKGVHRVNEYWSTMVIRALGDMDQPGIEYTLTYFDNPGTSLPQSITNFIAVTGFPNFLKKLHMAALQLQSFHERGEDVYVSLPEVLRYPQRHRDITEPLEHDVVKELDVIEGSDVVRVDSGSIEGTELRHGSEGEVDVLSITSDVEETEDADDVIMEGDVNMAEQIKASDSSEERETVTSATTTAKGTSDKALHINTSGKSISIDLLEAMEIVAPELEKKSLLMRKIEELNERLKSNGRQSVILMELRKLRHKLKSFREEATQRKEKSLKQMEQLSTRDHYNHMNVDEKTLTQLEMLFEAMRYVLQADKDMRTGKTLLNASVKNANRTDAKSTTDTKPDRRKDTQQTDITANQNTTKAKKKGNHECPPPKDPPPPPPPPPPPEIGEWREESEDRDDREGGTYAKLGSVVNNVDRVDSIKGSGSVDREMKDSETRVFEELGNAANDIEGMEAKDKNVSGSIANNAKEEEVRKSWFVGVTIPYISAWWDGAESKKTPENTEMTETNDVMTTNAQTSTLSQIFYVLTLQWIYSEERRETPDLSIKEDETVEEGESSGVRWYWFPFSGAYRIYAWITSTKMSA